MTFFDRQRERGTTLVEAALILPLMLFLILVFIHLVRIIAIRGLLTYAAEETLQTALTMPNFDVDIRTTNPASADYQRFVLGRRRILQQGANLALQSSLLTGSNTPSAAQLVAFSYQDPVPANGSAPAPISADVAVLRPAERVQIGGPASGSYLDNPAYPCPGPGIASPPMELLLQHKPIVVEIRARVKTFLPFLGDFVTAGIAQGFRDEIPRSPLPDEDPAITALDPTPWPTATPGPTSYPFPEPTAMPTPGGCQATPAKYQECKEHHLPPSLPDLSAPGPGDCPCLSGSILGN